jgi:molybdenum cofactor cytidylyltransferase
MIPRPWVVLLAAGASRRFGSPKQLARVGGESLLRRMARTALACRPAGCIVVLGARAPRLRRELAGLGVVVVVNRRWREGLSRSLAAGVAALPANAPGALVLLADQAALGPADLEVLCAAWRRAPGRIVAARVGDTFGPPAILPRRAFPALRRLSGDRGARALLRDPRRRAIGIELPGAALDVDRPSDLAELGQGG